MNYCGECICYLTDQDKDGNVTEYHHSTEDVAFCAIKDLFTNVNKNDKACKHFIAEPTTES